MDFGTNDNKFSFYSANMGVTKYQVIAGALVKNPDNDSPIWNLQEEYSYLGGEYMVLWDRFRKFDDDYVMIAYANISQDAPPFDSRVVVFTLMKDGDTREQFRINPSIYNFPDQNFVDADLLFNKKQNKYYSVVLETNFINFYSGKGASTDIQYDTSSDGLCPKKLALDPIDPSFDYLATFSVLSDCTTDTSYPPKKII